MQKKEIPEIDPTILMINIHSLCAYPFLASPIFKAIEKSCGISFQDEENQKLKNSVKEFIAFKLTKN